MSQPPSASSDRDSALHRILAEYWDAIESGQTPDQAQWLIRHPKFQAELSEFFADWNQLHSLAAATRQDDAAFSPAPPFRPPDDVAETRISCPATVVSGQSALVPGTFGSYDLLAELGQGGMGVVYQARQHQPERLVALKMLRPGHQASAVDLRRFKEEAEAVARLDHLHIVPVYEVGEHERVRFYTMKLLTGGSLAACLPRFVEDPQAAARILVPVARAVQHAHGRGVLHRDLKPSNILLDDSQRPYVADFGLARRLEANLELTQTGELVGTPPYMAPEQTRGGKQTVTVATDVYGLGAVLYALLTGSPPAQGVTVIDTLRQIQERDPPPPRSLNPRVHPDLETICLKALKKQPHQRYVTAEALADDLERYLRGQPILARPASRLERTWLCLRRNPVTATLLSTLIAAAVLLMVGLSTHNARLRDVNEQLDDSLGRAREAYQESLSAQRRAEQSETEANLLLYASDMALAARAARDGDPRQVRELLERHRPKPAAVDLRGFEWHHLWKLGQVDQRELDAHDQALYFVCYSPDGRWLATAGQDANIRLYDARTGQRQWVLPTGQVEVNGLAFTPDGRWLASAGDDGSVRIWDVASRDEVLKIAAHSRHAYQVVFVPDLNLLVSCGDDPVIRLWDMHSGRSLGKLEGHEKAVEAIALSPDGKQLASASSDMTARIWDLESRTVVQTLRKHSGRLSCLAFSHDGRWLATGSVDKRVRVRRLDAGETVFSAVDLDVVQSVGFSPDGRELAVGDRGGSLDLWRTADQDWSGDVERVRSWQAHHGRIYGLAFSPTDDSIASVGQGGRLIVWKRPTTQLRRMIELPEEFHNVAWVPGRDWLAVSGPTGVGLYDVPTCRPIKTLSTAGVCLAVAASANGGRVAAADQQGYIRLWNVDPDSSTLPDTDEEGTLSWSVGQPLPEACSLTFSPDGALLALAAFPLDIVFLFDTATGRLLAELSVRDCRCPVFSPDGRRLAIASQDDVQIWDVAEFAGVQPELAMSNNPAQLLTGHSSTVNALAYSPDGRYVASASSDRLIKVWDSSTGGERYSLAGHRGDVEGVAFFPDGRSLVSSGEDRAIHVWHVATGRPLYQLDLSDLWLWRLIFSPDGSHLVVMADNPLSTVLLYDTGRSPQ